MTKEQLLKKCNSHIRKMVNFDFYNSVKQFLKMDLSNKSVNQIQDICRNMIDKDVVFKYRKFNSIKIGPIEKGWLACYSSRTRTISFDEKIINDSNLKLCFCLTIFMNINMQSKTHI